MAGKRKTNTHNRALTGALLLLVLGLTAALAWNGRTLVAAHSPGKQEDPTEEDQIALQKPEAGREEVPAVPLPEEQPSPESPEDMSVLMPELEPEAEPAPAPVPEITPEPAPEPEIVPEPELPASLIPESEPVEDAYFEKSVFMGNSRTEGLKLYSGLKTGTFIYGTGATVDSIFQKTTWKLDGKTMPALDAVRQLDTDRIYTMFGTNELGWVRMDLFKERYGKVVDRLQADHPEATIILQSIIPVTKTQVEKHSYINNERIAQYNALIRELAEEKQCRYLDVQTALVDEDGFLLEEYSYDGVHLNRRGCTRWHEYLNTHAI